MGTHIHQVGTKQIIEIISDDILIKTPQDALELVMQNQSEHIVLHDHNFTPEFFDLSTRLAGEVLQKMTNYRVNIAIIGNFEKYPSKTLKDFIYETNKYKEHLFVESVEEALRLWSE